MFFLKGLPLKKLSFTGLSIFLILAIAPYDRVLAQLLGNYRATSTRKVDQKRTVGSGSRSPECQTSWKEDSLTLLIPEPEIVHKTTSDRPTFYFNARSTSPEPLIFNLISPEASSKGIPLVEKQVVVNQSGINKISLPLSVALEEGKLYLWQIGFPCEDETRSVAKVVKGAVIKVKLSDRAVQNIANTNSLEDKAKIYASSGIWYEALQLAEESNSRELLGQLLEEINVDTE